MSSIRLNEQTPPPQTLKIGPLDSDHARKKPKLNLYKKLVNKNPYTQLAITSKNLIVHDSDLHPADYQSTIKCDQIWNDIKYFVNDLKETHYVFLHSSSLYNSLFVDMQTHLDSSTPFPTLCHSKRWHTQRKLRPIDTKPQFENTLEYFQSDVCKNINTSKEKDNQHKTQILSCDGFLSNKTLWESAFYFFKKGSNVSSLKFKDFLTQHLKTADAINFSEYLFSTMVHPLIPQGMGISRVYVIAIEKPTVNNKKTCYVWRSHAYGQVCKCYETDRKYDHETFLSVLNTNQSEWYTNRSYEEGRSVMDKPCLNLAAPTPPQYRILAPNLDKDPTRKVFALDPKVKNDHEREQKFKDKFWALTSLLKQYQRLESISQDTPKELLVSILLRTRFDLHPKLKKEQTTTTDPDLGPQYIAILQEILATKKEILSHHLPYLNEHLKDVLEDYKKIGILFS